MTDYDFMMTNTFNNIRNQIIELWHDYDKDGNMEEIIEEFKMFYGNHENAIYYYDFEIEPHNIMCAQRFIIKQMEDAGFDLTVNDMFSIASIEGLKKHLLYWIMEDISFDEIILGC